MLYLLRSFGRKGDSIVKIGYTDDKNKRSKDYRIHNPLYETIGEREGDRYLEAKLHLYFTALGFKRNVLNEWFEDCPEVLGGFHSKLSKINRVIWKNRNRLFVRADFKDENLKCKIYEELRMLNRPRRFKEVDTLWKIEFNQKLLKKLRLENF